MCKYERFIESLGEPQSNREYWIITEVFVYLHDGKDCCNCDGIEQEPKPGAYK